MRDGRLRYDSDMDVFCFEADGTLENLLSGEIILVKEHPLDTRYSRFRIEEDGNGDWYLVLLRSSRRHPYRVKLERGHLWAARMADWEGPPV